MKACIAAYKKPLIVGTALLVAGFAAWGYQLGTGLLETTGLSNSFCWGLMIAMFAFLVGFGAGSQFVASYIVLAHREELRAYVPVAQSIALAGAVGAGVAVVADLGAPQHILAMLLGPQAASPLTWDMLALTAFIVLAAINLVTLARGGKHLRLWMILGATAALALQLVEGLLFALQGARAWWHTALMPADFLAVAVVCGLAVALLYCALAGPRFNAAARRHLALLLAGAVAVHLLLALGDLAAVALGGSPATQSALAAVAAYWPLYAAELLLSLAALVVLVASRRQGAQTVSIGCASAVIAGMFCHRLMLLYPAYASSTLFTTLSNTTSPAWGYPVSTGLYAKSGIAFQVLQGYTPSAMEWLSTLLPIGLAVIVVICALCVARGSSKTVGKQNLVGNEEAPTPD